MSKRTAQVQREPDSGRAQGISYFRVSTSEQANTSYDEDGFSIQAQREYCQRKAAELDIELVDEYIDRGKSARTTDRPGLQELLKRVKEDTDIQYVFVHKLDRLARNREDDVQIGLLLAKCGVRLVSATENIDDTPSGKLVRGIMADIAEWYSANLSEEAKKGLRKKVEIGGTPGKAALGYRNVRDKRDGKDIGIVVVDEVAGPLITGAFKAYDTGLCTLRDVTDEANDLGLRLPPTKSLPERPVTIQTMHRILHNRYYTGWVSYNGVEYKGEHTPLVDEDTFDRVQALLTARNLNKDKSKKRPHHLKGNIFCARCGRRFGITAPTNRHGVTYLYFYCLGRQKDKNSCPQGFVGVDRVEEAVRRYWGTIRLPAERIQALRQVVIASFAGKHSEGEAEIERQRVRIRKLEQRRKKAKEAYYADASTLDEFKAEQEEIRRGIRSAEETIAKWSVELDSIQRSLDEALLLLEDPQVLYEAMPEGLKVVLTQTVFEKIWIMDGDVAGAELTDAFGELLTLEAQIAWEEARREVASDAGHDLAVMFVTESGPGAGYRVSGGGRRRDEDDGSTKGGQGHGDGPDGDDDRDAGAVVYRRAKEGSWAAVEASAVGTGTLLRIRVERPMGLLPVDLAVGSPETGSDPSDGEGSEGLNVLHLVGVAGFEPTTSSSRTCTSRHVDSFMTRTIAEDALATTVARVGVSDVANAGWLAKISPPNANSGRLSSMPGSQPTH